MSVPARQASEYAALLERVAVLERDLAAVQATLAAAAKPAPDPLIEQRRLSAIAQAFGGSVFVVADVLRMAAHDPELRETVTGASARELGAWLRRLKARPLGGYRVLRVGRDDRGALWSLAVSADRHTPA